MKSQKLHLWESALLVAFAVFLLVGCCASAGRAALADRVLRLHVVANSDSAEDQAVKLKVRDAVLSLASERLEGCEGREQAEEVLAAGLNLLLEIEVEGAANVKAKYPDAVLIMLLPPSFAVQEARLRGRGTETEEKILARLDQARRELPRFTEYDYVVYNYDGCVKQTADKIRAIVSAETAAIKRNPNVAQNYFE